MLDWFPCGTLYLCSERTVLDAALDAAAGGALNSMGEDDAFLVERMATNNHQWDTDRRDNRQGGMEFFKLMFSVLLMHSLLRSTSKLTAWVLLLLIQLQVVVFVEMLITLSQVPYLLRM